MRKIAPFTDHFDVDYANIKTGKVMTEFEINEYLDIYHKIKVSRILKDKETNVRIQTTEYYEKVGSIIIDKKTKFSTCEQNFIDRKFTKLFTGCRHSIKGIQQTKLLLPSPNGTAVKVQKKLFKLVK